MRLVALALACTACAPGMHAAPVDAAVTVDAAPKAVLAVPGESMEYEVLLRGIVVGRVVTGIGQPGEISGRRVVRVRSHGTTAGVLEVIGHIEWEMTTTIDLDTGYAVDEDEEFTATGAGRHEHEHTQGTWTPDESHHNAHSAAALLRGWRSHLGDHTEVPVHFGHARIPIAVTDAARELVGSTPAVRYTGSFREHALAVWISDDEARVPLRLHGATPLGDFEVELVHYN